MFTWLHHEVLELISLLQATMDHERHVYNSMKHKTPQIKSSGVYRSSFWCKYIQKRIHDLNLIGSTLRFLTVNSSF